MRTAALAVALAAILGSAAAAVAHANPAFVGGAAAIAFAAMALWAGTTAVGLHAPDTLTEPRHRPGPTTRSQTETVVTRGGLFGRWFWLALGGFVVAGIVPLISLGRTPVRGGTAWRRGSRLVTPEGRLLRADDVGIGGIETVFPEGQIDAHESAVLLLRLEDGLAQLPPDRASWVPRGNLAYSKICTHAGCPVALYRKESYQLYCPCHQSVFDVLFGARPLAGPATRALPQLPLAVDAEGYLIAQGDFTEPVGPDSWWRTI